jgi:hypothetical protein
MAPRCVARDVSESGVMVCQLKLSPQCEGESEVVMRLIGFKAKTCLPCGKAFQVKFPHRISELTINTIAPQSWK